jgi:hypothetical protein
MPRSVSVAEMTETVVAAERDRTARRIAAAVAGLSRR